MAIALSLITSGKNIKIYIVVKPVKCWRRLNKKRFSWSQCLGVMELVSFTIHFLWRSCLTTVLVTELTHVRDVVVVKSRQ